MASTMASQHVVVSMYRVKVNLCISLMGLSFRLSPWIALGMYIERNRILYRGPPRNAITQVRRHRNRQPENSGIYYL